jgi:hypothetical protein
MDFCFWNKIAGFDPMAPTKSGNAERVGLGRVLRRAPPIRAAPRVLFGVLEAHPPLGTTPGVPGRELAAVCEIAINPLDAFLDTNWWLGTVAFPSNYQNWRV